MEIGENMRTGSTTVRYLVARARRLREELEQALAMEEIARDAEQRGVRHARPRRYRNRAGRASRATRSWSVAGSCHRHGCKHTE